MITPKTPSVSRVIMQLILVAQMEPAPAATGRAVSQSASHDVEVARAASAARTSFMGTSQRKR